METKPNFKMMLGNYIKLARPDHWIKQMFILPGVAFALALVPQPSDCGGGCHSRCALRSVFCLPA